MSNEEFFNWMKEETQDFKQLCVTVQFENGDVDTYYSQEDSFELLGMLEVAKYQVLNEMNE